MEDNPVNQKLLVGVLKKCDCDVTTAENGRVALEVLNQKSFDLVFMDVQMPEMDGFEATRRIRKQERWQDLPVIAMTAHALKGDRERCLGAGMNDYATKPIKAAVVRGMINKWAHTARVGREADNEEAAMSGSNGDGDQSKQTVVDIEQTLSQLDGDRELLHEVLDIFVDTLPSLMEAIQSAVSSGDGQKLRDAAHSLKGAASNVCAEPVRSTAQRLEEIGKRGELAGVDTVVADLRGHVERLLEFVEHLTDRPGGEGRVREHCRASNAPD